MMSTDASLLTLERHQGARSHGLTAWLSPFGRDNAFNPSMQRLGERSFVAFRHFGEDRRPPFEASLLVGPTALANPERTNLTQHAHRFGVPVVADPKLLRMAGQVWLTFNDGWSRTENHLFLMKVTPRLGRPIRCTYSGRQRVEKNWAFFESEGKLKALYGVDPLRILSADPPDDHTEELVFDPDGPAAPTATGLTIGSQLAEYGGAHYLVAHEKWRVASWRAYLVRWVKLRDLTTDPQIEVSPRRLCFSRRALLGQFPKHNRNLLSCTYFSGLQVEGGFAVLGFGINDVRFGFCEIRMDEL